MKTMKKLLIFALSLLPMLPLSGQNRVVEIARISETFAPPTVTFEVYWNAAPDNNRHRDSVWVFVDYQTVDNAGATGPWTPATLTPTSVSPPGTLSTVANGRGFYVKGTTSFPFSSTVTVALSGVVPANTKFNWCAYASDYPPNAEEGNGHYDLHGSPPFVVNGNTLADGVRTYAGCITALTDATGCPGLIPTKPVITSFTPADTAICAGNSVTLTATADSAASYSFNNGASWIENTSGTATIVVAPSADTTYILKVANAAGCIATSTASASVTVYPLPAASFSSATATACPGSSVTVIVDADAGSSYCFTHTCTACVHNPYTNGNGEPTDIDCVFDNPSCTFSASNSYTVTMPDAGSITVKVVVRNSDGCTVTIDTTITIIPLPTIVLITGNSNQTVDEGTTISTILYTTANATGAAATGLPTGISGVWSNNTFSISGTSSAVGSYPYTVTTTNADGCTNVVTGTITVSLILPTGAGTFVWSCGSQTWSGLLSNPVAGCSSESSLSTSNPPPAQYKNNGATYGYYYNWTCVNNTASTLCLSPWRVPTQADYNTLVSCTNYSTLISAWGIPGHAYGSSVYDGGVYADYWSSTEDGSTRAYSLRYSSGSLAVSYANRYYGFQVRCVRDN
jgi:hypothetical protein